ncbi:MAG: DUF488 domain-containing protein [Gemmatimonadaceae bacterium]|nr:DUF488 domain-containing protein [Gemmatimonadaceae bacterium]
MQPERDTSPTGTTQPTEACTVWTVGHSKLSEADFLALLGAYRIEALVDVRRFAASKRYPHFNESALQASLASRSIEYLGLPSLGGRRTPLPDSPNTGWRNESFRGYADHIATAAFAGGMRELRALAERRRTAIMCAEAVWWRCHRSLISDVLKAEGWRVVHILNDKSSSEHPYSSPARIIEGKLAYPADQLSLGE